MLWRIAVAGSVIVGAAVLAYQVGSRLSDEAVMTLVGVVCGIVATIPVSLGLIIALTRPRAVMETEEEAYGEYAPEPAPYAVYRPAPPAPYPAFTQSNTYPGQPQIIVVSPAQLPNTGMPYGNYLLPPHASPGLGAMQERNFKIVGDDEGE